MREYWPEKKDMMYYYRQTNLWLYGYICKSYLQFNCSIHEIAEMVDMSFEGVRKVLKRNDIIMRPRSQEIYQRPKTRTQNGWRRYDT